MSDRIEQIIKITEGRSDAPTKQQIRRLRAAQQAAEEIAALADRADGQKRQVLMAALEAAKDAVANAEQSIIEGWA